MERSVVEYTKATRRIQKRSGGVWCLCGFRGEDFHAPDQPILNEVDVLHHLIEEKGSIEPAHDLVDEHGGLTGIGGLKADGVNAGVNHGPLVRPVVAHALLAVHATSF